MSDHVACWLAIVLKCLLGRRSVEERGRLVTGLVRLPLLSHSMIADLSYVWPSGEGGSKVCLEGGQGSHRANKTPVGKCMVGR